MEPENSNVQLAGNNRVRVEGSYNSVFTFNELIGVVFLGLALLILLIGYLRLAERGHKITEIVLDQRKPNP